MTEEQVLEYVQLKAGVDAKLGMSRPVILAMAELALHELAVVLLTTNSSLAKKLITTLLNQTWNKSFAAPADMLFYKQKETTRIDLGGILAYQVEDRDKLEMSTGLGNIYYALEGKNFYIKHYNPATTSGTDLNIRYYKIPTIADIDDELRNLFIELVTQRVLPKVPSEK